MSESQDTPAWFRNRFAEWSRKAVMPPLGFFAELWGRPEDDPQLPGLKAKYGNRADSELVMLRLQLPREVVIAAGGLLYTLEKLEALLHEMQKYVEEHIPRRPDDEPEPEFGTSVSHPLLVEASFEFANFLSWLRAIDERLDRPYKPGASERAACYRRWLTGHCATALRLSSESFGTRRSNGNLRTSSCTTALCRRRSKGRV